MVETLGVTTTHHAGARGRHNTRADGRGRRQRGALLLSAAAATAREKRGGRLDRRERHKKNRVTSGTRRACITPSSSMQQRPRQAGRSGERGGDDDVIDKPQKKSKKQRWTSGARCQARGAGGAMRGEVRMGRTRNRGQVRMSCDRGVPPRKGGHARSDGGCAPERGGNSFVSMAHLTLEGMDCERT